MPNEIVANVAPELLEEFDLGNPRAMVNLVPGYIRERILMLNPEVLLMTEAELEWKNWYNQIPEDAQIFRDAFWDEYDRVMRYNEPMFDPNRILRDGFSAMWAREFVRDKYRLAWLIRIPREYEVALKDIHRLGLKQMRVIMAMALEKDGKFNVKLGELKFKILQHIDTRLKGAVIQRIEQKNLNVNVEAGGSAGIPEKPLTMDDIDARLARLRRESKSLEAPGSVQVDLMKPIMEAVHGVVEEAVIIDDDASKTP